MTAQIKKRKPVGVYLLIVCLVFQSVSGLFGGVAFLLDVNGRVLNAPLKMLANTPFSNFLIPGLILTVVLGLFPAFVSYGLITLKGFKWMSFMNIYKEQHWSWTGALYTGITLILWIDFEVMFIGYGGTLQTIYAFTGAAIVILSLLPSVKTYYLTEKTQLLYL